MTMKKWTKQKIIERLKREAKKADHPLVKKDVPPALGNVVRRYFGSWNKGKKAAGLEIARKGKGGKWTKEEIKKRLKEEAKKVEGPLTIRDTPGALKNAAYRYFKTWSRAKEAAGLNLYRVKKKGTLYRLVKSMPGGGYTIVAQSKKKKNLLDKADKAENPEQAKEAIFLSRENVRRLETEMKKKSLNEEAL